MKALHKLGTFVKFNAQTLGADGQPVPGSINVEHTGIITGVVHRKDGFHYEVNDEIVDQASITSAYREVTAPKPRAKKAPKGESLVAKATSAVKNAVKA